MLIMIFTYPLRFALSLLGFTVLLPLYLGRIENSESLTSTYFKTAAALAFVGGVIFEVGSYLMVVEALNR
jgi:hypothetical protein